MISSIRINYMFIGMIAATTVAAAVSSAQGSSESMHRADSMQTSSAPFVDDGSTLTHIPTCNDVGLCEEDEQRLLLDTTKEFSGLMLRYAQTKKCHVTQELQDMIGLLCPAGVTIPYTREERVFQVFDTFSNNQIGAAAVHKNGITGTGVLVAMLDTGIDASHPELRGRIRNVRNFTRSSDADVLGHGTHVAGIIMGQGVTSFIESPHEKRAIGVSPQANLIAGKVCDEQWCLEGDVIAGIEWAVSEGARVLNLSIGGGRFLGGCDTDPLAQKVNWAVSRNVVVVASAGNQGQQGEGIASPACASRAIAVGAVDGKDVRPSWSGYGTALDLVAPGVDILSPLPCSASGTCPNPGYGYLSGTSMATPHVTGLVALLLQQDTSLWPYRISVLLKSTAKDLGIEDADSYHGYGRVDAVAALKAAKSTSSSSSRSSKPSVKK